MGYFELFKKKFKQDLNLKILNINYNKFYFICQVFFLHNANVYKYHIVMFALNSIILNYLNNKKGNNKYITIYIKSN